MIAFTWHTVQSDMFEAERKQLNEKDLSGTLERLFNDPVQLIKKVSFDHKLQTPVFEVNYEGIFSAFQE
jgi:hypothetical protein